MATRRLANYVRMIAACLVAGGMTGIAHAKFPERPITIVVPYTPGSTGEITARLVADAVSKSLGTTVLLDHKPGGGTTIGAAAVARAPADGYTVFLNASSFLVNAQLMKNLPYDSKKDFAPLTLAASNPHVLVVPPQLKVKTFKEFLALANSRSQPIAFASCGIGCSQHLGFELLKNTYGLKGLHVPYKGGQEPMTAIMAGQVDALLADLAGALPFIKEGKMIALGVAGPQRAVQAPDIPTLEEASGKAFTSGSWWGFLLHANTKPDVKQILEREFSTALKHPDLKDKMSQRGITLHGTTSDEFGTFMDNESTRFAQAIELSGTKLE